MNTTLTELRFGDQIVSVAAVQPPGTEPTSAVDKLSEKAIDALAQAQSTIEAVAHSTAHTVAKLAKAATSPASVEVELGIAFSAQGGVIVAGGGVAASIVVHLTYDLTHKEPGASSAGQARPPGQGPMCTN